MNPQQILGLQVLLSLVGWALLARWYGSPRLATRPREEARCRRSCCRTPSGTWASCSSSPPW